MRLLILGCSSRKRTDSCHLPALERYDGPSFGVLRKFLRAGESDLHIFIVSARFGLVSAGTPVPLYDERMTVPRAQELREEIIAALSAIFRGNIFESAFFDLGRDYWAALEGWRALVPSQTGVVIAGGSSGRRAALLREWLRDEVEPVPASWSKSSSVRLGNHIWRFKRDAVLEIARRRLRECDAAGDLSSGQFHSWCAWVDGRAIAPKWLVSQVTGLPPSAFHTQGACRALACWGIEVERCSLTAGATENFPENFSSQV